MDTRVLYSVVLLMYLPVMGHPQASQPRDITFFLAGDVMIGRGVDQILAHSVDPVLYEPYVRDARVYVQLAEKKHGEISVPVNNHYIWGDALAIWEEKKPAFKLVNLETSITTNEVPWKGKGIHYRMHPQNIAVLRAAGIDIVSLANNHVMDWGIKGLETTLRSLSQHKIKFSGAGMNRLDAQKPAVFQRGPTRVLVYSFGASDSGIPGDWAAGKDRFGINLLNGFGKEQMTSMLDLVRSASAPEDLVILSIHWGGNWGYGISVEQRDFAHGLIDSGQVDLIFGHSSHHPKGIEVYQGKLIIYGAGDFMNDYEGITGYEAYRGELSLMYFPTLDVHSGKLKQLEMVPMKIEKLQLKKASLKDTQWLTEVLDREGKKLGTGVKRGSKNSLWLEW